MGLNIKNKEAYELASELARLTGKSMTAVVVDALRKQQEEIQWREKKQPRVQALMAIGKRCAAHIHQPATAIEHGDMLYNEVGLPQ